MKRRLYLLCSIIVLIGIGGSKTQAEHVSEGLQQVVLDYAIKLGKDTSETKKMVERVLEQLTQLKVSPCEVSSELNAKNPGSEQQIRYLLSDIVETKLQSIRAAEEIIQLRLGKQESLTENDRAAIKQLSIEIASSSMSITELKEEIIPSLFQAVGKNLNRVNEIDLKVDLLELQLRRLDSICDKVAILWEERSKEKETVTEYKMLRPDYEQNFTPSLNVRKDEWRSVNGTKWEPQAYASSQQLCKNPKPGPTNVYFDARIHTQNGLISHRYYGDIWVNCSGQIVMVVRN